MIEPKPLASLTSGLLARKGGARPAMRRPYVSGSHVHPSLPLSVQEDLGWNDMGHDEESEESQPAPPLAMIRADVPEPAVEAEAPTVIKQQEQLTEQFADPVEREEWKPAPMVRPRGAKAAFTLRLDADRHLRLRLACAVSNRSAQQIVTQALDDFLNSQPQVEALAQQVPGTDGTNPTRKP